MSNHSKLKREKLAAATADLRTEIVMRKREQRAKQKAKYADASTRREKLWALFDGVWYILGGPLVWLFHRGPIFRKHRDSTRPRA